jgi:branched-chain amino acid transport system substrate-binding protein
MNIRKSLRIISFIFVFFGVFSFLTAPGLFAKDPIKIGANLGMTGFMALDGKTTLEGIKIKLDEIGWKIDGRKIELLVEDNASDPVMAVDKARKQVERDKVDVVLGPVFSPAAFAMVDYLAKSGTPAISIFGHGETALNIGADLLFVPMGMHFKQGYLMGKYAGEKLGVKTAIMIYVDEDTGDVIANGVEAGLKESGGALIQRHKPPMGTMDYTSYIINSKKSDAVFFWIFGNMVGPFVTQYRDSGKKMPLILPMVSNLQEPVMKEIGDASLNIYGSDHYVPLIDNAINNKFAKAYLNKYGEQPNTDAFGGWLATTLFLEAVKATGGDTSHKAIVKAMAKVKINTPTGMYTFSKEKNAYIGTGNFFIVKSAKMGKRYTWKPVHTYKQIRFDY